MWLLLCNYCTMYAMKKMHEITRVFIFLSMSVNPTCTTIHSEQSDLTCTADLFTALGQLSATAPKKLKTCRPLHLLWNINQASKMGTGLWMCRTDDVFSSACIHMFSTF